MVKNTIGGKKGKMLANKRSGSTSGGNHKLVLSSHPDEFYVCVSKVFGGGIFEVVNNNNVIFKAHLRGKMKGHNKRHNFISLFSILLVGIRSDLSSSNICDVLFVYDDHDILSLSLLPNISFANIHHFHLNHSFIHNHTDNHFISPMEKDIITNSIDNTEQIKMEDIDIDIDKEDMDLSFI
jgi:hypothetical protein